MNDIFVTATHLRHFMQTVLMHEGIPAAAARQAAETLLYADLAGLDTHGVLNLLSVYVAGIRAGEIDPAATLSVVSDRGATMVVDARRMPGLNAGHQAMLLAMEKARTAGVGVVCVRNSTHFGAAGYYASMAMAENMIGMAMTNLGAAPVAHAMGSQRPVIGTNPVALAAPVANMPDFVLDISTTVCASGKIKQASAKQTDVPASWLCDARGAGVTQPEAYFSGQAFLPGLGGWEKATGGHKGFGLNLMVEVLSGVLSGADVPLVAMQGQHNQVGHFFLALDIAAFLPVADFSQRMARMLDSYAAEPTFDDFAPLQYPGQPDASLRQQREARGVPLANTVFQQLNAYAQQHSLPQLESLP